MDRDRNHTTLHRHRLDIAFSQKGVLMFKHLLWALGAIAIVVVAIYLIYWTLALTPLKNSNLGLAHQLRLAFVMIGAASVMAAGIALSECAESWRQTKIAR